MPLYIVITHALALFTYNFEIMVLKSEVLVVLSRVFDLTISWLQGPNHGILVWPIFSREQAWLSEQVVALILSTQVNFALVGCHLIIPVLLLCWFQL